MLKIDDLIVIDICNQYTKDTVHSSAPQNQKAATSASKGMRGRCYYSYIMFQRFLRSFSVYFYDLWKAFDFQFAGMI